MKRGATGHYVATVAGGVRCQAFVPHPLPPAPPITLSGDLEKVFAEAYRALGGLDVISSLLPDPGMVLYSYVRKEAVMSSQIEGTQSSLDDLLIYEAEGVPGAPLDDVEEVSAYVRALNTGIQRIREEGWPIARRVVLELHEILMTAGRGGQRRPGKFRNGPVWLGHDQADKALHVAPPANEVAQCWSDLEHFINATGRDMDPLIRAALAHVQFETIHPFFDGNGRVGRMLIPLMLVQDGVLGNPLLFLSVYFKEHRQTYYELLQSTRTEGDWEEWLAFFLRAVATTANEAVDTAVAIRKLQAEHLARLPTLGRGADSAARVLEALVARPVASAPELIKRTGLTRPPVYRALRDLEEKIGVVQEITGRKRGQIFAYRPLLELLHGSSPPIALPSETLAEDSAPGPDQST